MRGLDLDLADELAVLCPRLGGRYTVTSPRTSRYNCLAFAAGDERVEWVPGGDPDATFWPIPSLRSLALEDVVRAYVAVGFEPLAGALPGESVALLALYVDFDGLVVHAARREPNGKWRSKIGVLEDIEHDTPDALEGGEYGFVACTLRRRA